MQAKEVYNQDMTVDLEKGNCLLTREERNGMDVNSVTGHTRITREGSWDDLVSLKDDRSHHMSCCSSHCQDSVAKNGEAMSSEGEMKAGRSDNSVGDKEKKKRFKKPPRPPRPPTTSPLDPADQKLISELSELAVLKRARIERMKALKKMKNSKPASSIGNLGSRQESTPMAQAIAAGHLPVPNVQALAQTCNGSSEQVPERYIRTEEATAEEVVAGRAIPVVDLSKLLDLQWSEDELAKLGCACQLGFFQLINHGVPDEVVHNVRRDIAKFFKLPLEAKKEYAQVPESGGLQGYGQAFVFSETQKLDWSDMLYLVLRPMESRDMRFWPAQPPSFRNSVDRYSAESAKVVSSLLRFMAADMGVEPERLLELFRGQPQTMRVTYYPPCRQASKVLGLSPHTDACALTLLLHVNDVQGLQIRSNDGKWLNVEPMDGALVVSVGDLLEASKSPLFESDLPVNSELCLLSTYVLNLDERLLILSNGRYKSVEHRAVVHPNRERIAAALFHQVHPTTTVGPLPELVERGGVSRYRSVSHADFLKHFFSSKFDGRKSHLDHYRI
ncbi:hypothetical protein EJB05_57972 [Eragrostis curvula]|uniref:Fe2OG dioxygenase domain-containing protein n=1 Tax=Eragrostis curvula TaxID=38414 RepID=A0A5J9SC24_9POAL|nr:hypothetical protein EJB05_57972 [Eragrostis curvula]